MSFTSSPPDGPALRSVSRGWVMFAAIALFLTALAGTALGISRSLGAHDVPSDSGDLTPVPNTTAAKALPADSAFDESRVRAIAREEAQAALVHSAPRPKAAPKPDAETDDGDATDGQTLAIPKTPALTVVKPTVTTSAKTSSPLTTNPYPPGAAQN